MSSSIALSDQQATYYRDPDTGHLMMPGSKRPDGTWRKPRRIKEGYVPQDEVPLYESKGKQWAKARDEQNGPVGLSSAILNMKIDTFDSRSLQPAYHIPGLSPDTPPVGQESKSKNSKKKKKNNNNNNNNNNNLSNSAVNSCQPHHEPLEEVSPLSSSVSTHAPDSQNTVATDPAKKLRNLRKKLRDIETLEKKLENGEIAKPEPEQLEKVARKEQVEEEIAQLEKIKIMFRKAFRVKSKTQMKGSEKKKFKAELKLKFPNFTDEFLNDLLPNKEEVMLTKIYTFNGESVLVYFHQKNPLFFELEKDKLIFPTIYTLWRYPDILLYFPTWTDVLPKLANGADLMLPGIVVDHSLGVKAYHEGKIKKGDPLAINLLKNKSAFAIGTAFHSSEDMYMAGRKGKGVKILHFYGDQLWYAGSRQVVPDVGPPEGLEFLESSEQKLLHEGQDSDEEEEDVANSELEKDDSKVDEPQDSSQAIDVEGNSNSINKLEEAVEKNLLLKDDERTPQEKMDQLLLNSFLQAWKLSAKKVELPILTSNFFRVHMVPQCPRGQSLDVKKSSYKKLSKFLIHMQKEKIIDIKELQKGVESITNVDLNHEKIANFRVQKVEKEVLEDDDVQEVLPCDIPYTPPQITELHTVSANVVPFFKLFSLKKGDGLTSVQVRELIKTYVTDNQLQIQDDKGKVQLDPILAGIVLSKGENDITVMSYQDLNSRIQMKMSEGYQMVFENQPPVIHKGKLSAINISTATRSGNKKVTLIHNLELFKIDLVEFARKCQVKVAASTSVHEAINMRPGAQEILIQGNQVKFVSKLLIEEYKIPRKFVKGIEDTGGKKNKKK